MVSELLLTPNKSDFDDEVAGLIHGYLMSPDAPPRRLNAREAVQAGESPRCDGEFLWLHINLNHARAQHWVQRHFQVDEDFFEEIHSASSRTRLAEQGEALMAILNDVTFSQEEHSAQNATLWIWCRRQLLLSLLGEQERQLEQVVRRTSLAVDAIEERLLSPAIKANRSELGQLRRMLLRIQRLLAPEPAALFRLLNRPPAWLNRDTLRELRAFTEEFSVVLNDLASLMERIRLLQEEIAARLMEQSNRTLFLLTVITVLALPINIVAGFFGMNVGGIPLAGNAHGFLILVLVVLAFTVVAGWLALRRPGK